MRTRTIPKEPNFRTSVVVNCYFSRTHEAVLKSIGLTKFEAAVTKASKVTGSPVFVHLVGSPAPYNYGSFWFSNKHGFFYEIPAVTTKKVVRKTFLEKALSSLENPLGMFLSAQRSLPRKKLSLYLSVSAEFPEALKMATRILSAITNRHEHMSILGEAGNV